jgi:hypothetical protein
MRHAKMLDVKPVRPNKIPRGFGDQFKWLGWQELVGRHHVKKGQRKPGVLTIKEKDMPTPFLHWIAALPRKARDGVLRRNFLARPVRAVFPSVQRADQSLPIHGPVTKMSAEMRTTPGQHNYAPGLGPIPNESAAREFDVNRGDFQITTPAKVKP